MPFIRQVPAQVGEIVEIRWRCGDGSLVYQQVTFSPTTNTTTNTKTTTTKHAKNNQARVDDSQYAPPLATAVSD